MRSCKDCTYSKEHISHNMREMDPWEINYSPSARVDEEIHELFCHLQPKKLKVEADHWCGQGNWTEDKA
jgi:hypothetical protein